MTILIVDDNKQNIYLLQVILQGDGYQVAVAADGNEALVIARKAPPALIISDILMPQMDGFTLCREWQKDERLRPIPFIFYTATYTDDRDREFALSLGAAKFMIKPEEPAEFLRAIHEVIQQVQGVPAEPKRAPAEAPPEDDPGYLQQYNAALIRKLEAKMQQLEQTNHELERGLIERKKIEQLVAFKAMLLEASVETSIDGILAVDGSGHIILANRHFSDLWKIPRDILNGSEDAVIMEYVLQQLHDPGEFSRKVKYLYEHTEEKSTDEIEFTDGRCFDRYSAPLRGNDGKYYGRIWYFHDITERRIMEREIRKRLDELEIYYKATVGREERIIELKKEIATLKKKQGLS